MFFVPQSSPGLLSVPALVFLEDIEDCKFKCTTFITSILGLKTVDDSVNNYNVNDQ